MGRRDRLLDDRKTWYSDISFSMLTYLKVRRYLVYLENVSESMKCWSLMRYKGGQLVKAFLVYAKEFEIF